MQLIKHPYYNPYFVNVGNKTYTLNSIRVFDENGIVCKTRSGWWGNNNYIGDTAIDVDCVAKRAVDFSCKTAFVVKSDCNYEVRYDLYLPNSVMNVSEPRYDKYVDMIRVSHVSALDNRMVFEQYVSNNGKLAKIKDELRTMEDGKFYLSDTDTAIANVEKFLKTLKKKKKEEERLASMSAKEVYDEFMKESAK